MWVPLVENNEFNGKGADYFVKKNVDALLAKAPRMDTVILACTHYPLLLPKIRERLPEGVTIVEQGNIVAESLKDYLKRHPEMNAKCSKKGTVKFYTTESAEKFRQTVGLFFSGDVQVEHIHL